MELESDNIQLVHKGFGASARVLGQRAKALLAFANLPASGRPLVLQKKKIRYCMEGRV